MKILITQLSSNICFFLPFLFGYFPQYQVLEDPQYVQTCTIQRDDFNKIFVNSGHISSAPY
jgi:hypothetical protein